MHSPIDKKRGAEALRIDRVLSDGQLERLGVKPAFFPGRLVSVKPSFRSRHDERIITFRALDERTLLDNTVHGLAHFAGTAEIRHSLRNQVIKEWSVGSVSAVGNEPDARGWTEDGEQLLIEYDAGYRGRVVRDKIETFRKEGLIVWGTPSPLRADRIRQGYPDVQVVVTPWWQGPTERAQTVSGGSGGMRASRMADNLARQL